MWENVLLRSGWRNRRWRSFRALISFPFFLFFGRRRLSWSFSFSFAGINFSSWRWRRVTIGLWIRVIFFGLLQQFSPEMLDLLLDAPARLQLSITRLKFFLILANLEFDFAQLFASIFAVIFRVIITIAAVSIITNWGYFRWFRCDRIL